MAGGGRVAVWQRLCDDKTDLTGNILGVMVVEPWTVRAASPDDAATMATILNETISIGGTTAHRRYFDQGRIFDTFIQPKHHISCYAAFDNTILVGFQALEWSDPDWPGEDRLPSDWAIISTYVRLGRHGQGIGSTLFNYTRAAALAAGVSYIDATIRRENTGGLKFYAKLGFVEYRRTSEIIAKRIASA